MPFNLRGGRPKSMKQGIYWVQRHQADLQRTATAAKRDAAQATKKAKADAKNALLIATYERLFGNVKSFFDELPEFSASRDQADAISAAQAEWEIQRASLVENPRSITMASLRKFGTAGKNLIVICAKPAGLDAKWLPASRHLRVGDQIIDFS